VLVGFILRVHTLLEKSAAATTVTPFCKGGKILLPAKLAESEAIRESPEWDEKSKK
jgi:hypothetical protein